MEDERRAVDFDGHYAKQIEGSNSLSLRLRNFDSSGRRKTSPIEADMDTERIDLRVSLGVLIVIVQFDFPGSEPAEGVKKIV
jgi:hypothetical protein